MDALGISFVDVDVGKALKLDKKQKKAEKKRLKKEKKSSRHKNRVEEKEEHSDSGNSGDDGQNSGGEYDGQNEIPAQEPAIQRDSWMTANEPTGRNILTGEILKPEAKDKSISEDLQPKHKAKELNPENGNAHSSRRPTPKVGDGGASWREKALRRAQQLAEDEGRNVDEIVSNRFGSLSRLTNQVTNERAAHAHAHLHAQKNRVRQQEGENADYLQNVGSNKSLMRRPDPRASLSWRKRADHHSEDRDLRRQDDRDSSHRRNSDSRQDSHGDRYKRPSNAHMSDARPYTDSRHSKNKADLLQKVAGKLNKFSNDGSFMENFEGRVHIQSQKGESAQNDSAGDSRNQATRVELPDDRHAERAELDSNVGHNGKGYSAREIDDSASGDGDNRSAAAKLRARLLGKKAPKSTGHAAPTESKKQVELLPSVDAEGRAMPGTFGRDSAGTGQIDGGRKVKRVQRFEEGEKQRYYRDDDRSLDDLVREQRHHADKDIDANLAENIARKARFKEKDLDVDEEYDVDGGLDMYESLNKNVTKERAAKRQRIEQISDARRHDKALDNCNLCFGSRRFQKHLLVALAQVAYLSIPERGRLHPLHCIIAPTEHIPSSRKVDEHVWTEMRNFKKCVIQMNAKQGLNTLFWETAMRLTDSRSHAVVHCVPLDDKAFHKASVVFKKSLDEAESEWSQHHAKAVIDTRAKGLRGSIPANFPYFFVEFGLSAGYAHVIDSEEKFDKDFGRSIVAGLLKLDAEHQKRAAKAESVSVQEKLVKEFIRGYEPFDWTQQLE